MLDVLQVEMMHHRHHICNKDDILIIPARMLATDIRRELVFKSINLDSIHILSLSTGSTAQRDCRPWKIGQLFTDRVTGMTHTE